MAKDKHSGKSGGGDTAKQLAEELIDQAMSVDTLLALALEKLPNTTDEDDSRALLLGAQSLSLGISGKMMDLLYPDPGTSAALR